MKRLLSVLLTILLLVPNSAFATVSDALETAAVQLESSLQKNDGYITLPSVVDDAISVSWSWESDALIPDGNKALYVPKANETEVTLTAVLSKDGESFEKEIDVTVPARDVPIENCEYGENFDSSSLNTTDNNIPKWVISADGYDIADSVLDPNGAMNVNFMTPLSPASGEKLVIEMKMKSDRHAGQLLTVDLKDSSNTSHTVFGIQAYNDNLILRNQAGVAIAAGKANSEWIVIKMIYDPDDGKWDTLADGVSTQSDIALSAVTGGSLSRIAFTGAPTIDYIKAYIDPYDQLDEAVASITVPAFESITGDISLPETVDGYTVRWISSDDSIIAPDGTVNRPEDEDTDVTMYAVIEDSGCRVAKKFTAHIVKQEFIELGELETAATQLESSLQKNDSYITLPSVVDDAISVSWSWESDALIPDGNKALYVPKANETEVTLTAVLSKDGESFEKEIDVTVPARDVPIENCEFGENLEEISSLPNTWTTVVSGQDSISIGTDPKDSQNSVLVIDNTATGGDVNITMPLDEEVKATGTDPIITVEYKFCITAQNSAQLMYIYGGENAGAIPVNMNNYNDYAFAQGSAGNHTFVDPCVANKWYHVKVELDNSDKTFNLYLDGELVLDGMAYRISNADSVAKFLLGRGANKKGITYYDDIKVYINPYEKLDKAVASISGESFVAVKGTLSLPETVNGYTVKWMSSDEDIIAPDGTVNRPVGEDADVSMTAVIEDDGYRVAKKFTAHVVAKAIYDNADEEAVNNDADVLNINGIIGSQEINSLTEDFDLPLISENGAEIVWSSSDNNTVAVLETGKALVIRGRENSTATLTAVLKKGGFEASREFSVTVKKMDEYAGPYVYFEDFETTTEFNLDDPRPKYTLNLVNGTAEILNNEGKNGSRGVKLYSPNVDGNNAQIEIYTGDVTGTAVIEADVKNINGTGNNIFYCYGDSSLYANMNLQNRLVIRNGEKDEVVIASLPLNTWYRMRVVCHMEQKTWDVYVDTDGDGILELIKEGAVNRMEAAKINHLLFGGAKNVDFRLDNIKMYQDPFFPAENAAQKLDLGRIDGLEGDLLLPTEIDGGISVSWISSDTETLSTDGSVTRPHCDTTDKNVILYGIFEKDGYRAVRRFDATVLREKTDQEAVEADAAAILLYDIDYLTHDLVLPEIGQNGTRIEWSSSNDDVVTYKGVLTRPAFNNGEKVNLVLTATVTKNDKTFVRTFAVVVPEWNYSLTGDMKASTNGASSFLIADGNSSTFWNPASNDAQPYVMVTLKESTAVDFVRVIADTSPSSIEISDNGQSFEKVSEKFDSRNVKYVKINFAPRTVPKVYEVGTYNIGTANVARIDALLINLGSLNGVTADLTLPVLGQNGSSITWASSNTSVISNSGNVTRPNSGNVTVTLTATVKNGTDEVVRSFSVTVKGKIPSSDNGGGGGGSSNSSSINVSGSTASKPYQTEPVVPQTPQGYFTDVKSGSWYYAYVNRMAQDNILNGVGNGKFEPERTITRAEFLKVLIESLHIKADGDIKFSDVTESDWFYSYISTAYNSGITQGIDEVRFAPFDNITRQDIALMVARAMNLTTEADKVPFDFETVSEYAQSAVKALFAEGILNGDQNGNFNPHSPATRAEVAKIMYSIKYERGE